MDDNCDDFILKLLKEIPDLELNSELYQEPDPLIIPTPGATFESFMYYSVSPTNPTYDADSLNRYVNENILPHFRPDNLQLAKEIKEKRHIFDFGNSKLSLPLLSSSKQYLLEIEDRAVVKEIFGVSLEKLISGHKGDRSTFYHRINYDIAVFPDKDISLEYFTPRSHTFKEPFTVPMSALNNPMTPKKI
ncbi:MAG: hypothetical protein KAI18_02245 [Candidatus Aenigmarchaeota archaeon]|nr:hypothetical protein [Candidatus Aenigmarchaeota archaeon]